VDLVRKSLLSVGRNLLDKLHRPALELFERIGILDAIAAAPEKVAEVECLVSRGGVLAMRPLIAYASSKSHSESPRRVLHIEYAPCACIEQGLELAIS